MSNFLKNQDGLPLEIIKAMEVGYEDMGMLNASLSEEGLDQDGKDLESYEKYLVESE